MEPGDDPDGEPEVNVLFRNGNLTVFGILLAFSLGFLNVWANNPNDWQLRDLPTLALLSVGILYQGNALWLLLQTDSLKKRVFEAGTRRFSIGLLLTAIGVILSIAIDLVHILI